MSLGYFWLGEYKRGKHDPDAVFMDGQVWIGNDTNNVPDAYYDDEHLQLAQGPLLTDDYRYDDGMVTPSTPMDLIVDPIVYRSDAVASYNDDTVWATGRPGNRTDAAGRYRGDVGGALAAAALLVGFEDMDGPLASPPEHDGSSSEESETEGDTEDESASESDGPETDESDRETGSGEEGSGRSDSSRGSEYGRLISRSSSESSYDSVIPGDVPGWVIAILIGVLVLMTVIMTSRSGNEASGYVEPAQSEGVPSPPARDYPVSPPAGSVVSGRYPRGTKVIAFASGSTASLAVTPRFELAYGSYAITDKLQYMDASDPKRIVLSSASATERFRLVSICGGSWCDDVRIADFKQLRLFPITSFSTKESTMERTVSDVMWSSNDKTAILWNYMAEISYLDPALAVSYDFDGTSSDSLLKELTSLTVPGAGTGTRYHLGLSKSSFRWVGEHAFEIDASVWEGHAILSESCVRLSVPVFKAEILTPGKSCSENAEPPQIDKHYDPVPAEERVR